MKKKTKNKNKKTKTKTKQQQKRTKTKKQNKTKTRKKKQKKKNVSILSHPHIIIFIASTTFKTVTWDISLYCTALQYNFNHKKDELHITIFIKIA